LQNPDDRPSAAQILLMREIATSLSGPLLPPPDTVADLTEQLRQQDAIIERQKKENAKLKQACEELKNDIVLKRLEIRTMKSLYLDARIAKAESEKPPAAPAPLDASIGCSPFPLSVPVLFSCPFFASLCFPAVALQSLSLQRPAHSRYLGPLSPALLPT
jgi:hypothetical protein